MRKNGSRRSSSLPCMSSVFQICLGYVPYYFYRLIFSNLMTLSFHLSLGLYHGSLLKTQPRLSSKCVTAPNPCYISVTQTPPCTTDKRTAQEVALEVEIVFIRLASIWCIIRYKPIDGSLPHLDWKQALAKGCTNATGDRDRG